LLGFFCTLIIVVCYFVAAVTTAEPVAVAVVLAVVVAAAGYLPDFLLVLALVVTAAGLVVTVVEPAVAAEGLSLIEPVEQLVVLFEQLVKLAAIVVDYFVALVVLLFILNN